MKVPIWILGKVWAVSKLSTALSRPGKYQCLSKSGEGFIFVCLRPANVAQSPEASALGTDNTAHNLILDFRGETFNKIQLLEYATPPLPTATAARPRHKKSGWQYLKIRKELLEIRWCQNDRIFKGI